MNADATPPKRPVGRDAKDESLTLSVPTNLVDPNSEITETVGKTVSGDETLRTFARAGIPTARKHLFFCLGPNCCQKEQGLALWGFAKKRIADLKLPVMRTKADCFRICCEGPWLVVYPDGIWYGRVTSERLDRILREHVVLNRPVAEWVSIVNPLSDGLIKLV